MWPPEQTIQPAGPSGLSDGTSLPFALRSDIFEDSPDMTRPLCMFVIQVDVLPYIPSVTDASQPFSSLASATSCCSTGAGDDDDADGTRLAFPEMSRKAQGCVIIKGVLPGGASAAIVVSGYRPAFYVAVPPQHERRAHDWARDLLSRVEREMRPWGGAGAGGGAGGLTFSIVTRSRTYGFHADEADPKRHAAFSYAQVRAPNAVVRRSAAMCMIQKFDCHVEEWTVPEDFQFYDEHHLLPQGWCVVPARAYSYRPVDARRTLRQHEFGTSSESVLGIAEFVRLNPGVRLPVRPDDVPPQLMMYFDVEVATHNVDEFPNADNPHAEITTVSMAFAWVGGCIPPALRRADADEDLAGRLYGEHAERIRCSEHATRVQKFLDERAERVRMRSERKAFFSCAAGGGRASCIDAEELNFDGNSEDESEGEEQGLARLDGKLQEKLHEVRQESARAASSFPWPACRAVERSARVHTPCAPDGRRAGVLPDHTFLHVTLVNQRDIVSGRSVPCAAVDGVVIENHPDEASVLMAFRDYARLFLDVDGIRGYNILGFDFPYMIRRAQLLCIQDQFLQMSYIIRHAVRPRHKKTKVTAGVTLMPGLNCVDLYQYVQETLAAKLSGFKLQDVARHYGIQGKHEVTYKHVALAHRNDGPQPSSREEQSRHKALVAAYCAQDANLCVQISMLMKAELGWVQFSRIMKTPPETMWSSGQQSRVINMILWRAHRPNEQQQVFVVDRMPVPAFMRAAAPAKRRRDAPPTCQDDVPAPETGTAVDDDQAAAESLVEAEGISMEEARRRVSKRRNRYEGGFVFEPVVGFYDDDGDDVVEDSRVWELGGVDEHGVAVAVHRETKRRVRIGRDGFILCLDFASLYPSMQMSANLCYSTLLRPEDCAPTRIAWLRERGVRVDQHDLGCGRVACFAQNVGSIVPELLFELKRARKDTKARMERCREEGDLASAAILDLQQAAIKVSMNSVYGTMGSGVEQGKYPCPQIAAVITLLGRNHAHEAEGIATNFRQPALVEHIGCQVIYGDTDSIFVKVPRPNPAWLRQHRGLGRAQPGADPEPASFTYEERVLHAHQVGEAISRACNELYRQRGERSVELEFEKLLLRMLLWRKKQYGMLQAEKLRDALARSFKLEIKGIAAKKRDREPITARAQLGALQAVLEGDVERAWLIVRRALLRMARGHVDRRQLLIAKRVGDKVASLNTTPPAHIAVVWHLEKQMPGKEPGRGEYVKYWLAARPDPERVQPPPSVIKAYHRMAADAIRMRDERAAADPAERQQQRAKEMMRRFIGARKPEVKTIEVRAAEEVAAKIAAHQHKQGQTLHARAEGEAYEELPYIHEYLGRMIGPFRVVLSFTVRGRDLEDLYVKCTRIASRAMHAAGHAVSAQQMSDADIGAARMRLAVHRLLHADPASTKTHVRDISLDKAGTSGTSS